jgi:hypothetical protein
MFIRDPGDIINFDKFHLHLCAVHFFFNAIFSSKTNTNFSSPHFTFHISHFTRQLFFSLFLLYVDDESPLTSNDDNNRTLNLE